MGNIYQEIGVRPVINAYGNRTLLGGGTPNQAVRAAMDASEEFYVDMSELYDAVGVKIADMLGIQAALVTNGAAAALTYGAAGCMTGTDRGNVDRLPDTSGMPNEFIIQKQLRLRYDRCMTIPGGRLIEVGEKSGIPVQPSHLKALGKSVWGKSDQALSLIEAARNRGVDISCDQYPYEASSSTLLLLFPQWANDGGVHELLNRLDDVLLMSNFPSSPDDFRHLRQSKCLYPHILHIFLFLEKHFDKLG